MRSGELAAFMGLMLVQVIVVMPAPPGPFAVPEAPGLGAIWLAAHRVVEPLALPPPMPPPNGTRFTMWTLKCCFVPVLARYRSSALRRKHTVMPALDTVQSHPRCASSAGLTSHDAPDHEVGVVRGHARVRARQDVFRGCRCAGEAG